MATDEMFVFETLVSIIKSIKGNGDLIITPKTNLIKDIDMDSIMLMMMVLKVEEKFQITLPDSFLYALNISNFELLLSTVEELVLSKESSAKG